MNTKLLQNSSKIEPLFQLYGKRKSSNGYSGRTKKYLFYDNGIEVTYKKYNFIGNEMKEFIYYDNILTLCILGNDGFIMTYFTIKKIPFNVKKKLYKNIVFKKGEKKGTYKFLINCYHKIVKKVAIANDKDLITEKFGEIPLKKMLKSLENNYSFTLEKEWDLYQQYN